MDKTAVVLILLVCVILIAGGVTLDMAEDKPMHYHEFRTKHEIGDMIMVKGSQGVIIGFTLLEDRTVYYEYVLYSEDELDGVVYTVSMNEVPNG